MNDLENLGRDVRRALGDGPGAGRRRQQRRAVLAGTSASPSPTLRWPAVAVSTVAIIVAFAGGWWVQRWATPVTSVPDAQVAREGAVVEGGETSSPSIAFADGSIVEVGWRSRVRLSKTSTRVSHVHLERGTLAARVNPATTMGWVFFAGEHRVVVVGTILHLTWRAESGRLRVAVDEGSVLISGPGAPEEPRSVSAGEVFEYDGRRAPVTDIPPAVDETPSLDGAAQTPRAKRPNARKGRSVPALSWRDLADEGDYRGALELARQVGFRRLIDELPVADLQRLAEAARYARDARRAELALRALRRRFPEHRAARLAAFLLGRVAMDLASNPSEGVRWFRRYLKESPSGELAAEARGRLIEALVSVGDRAAAYEAAREYLQRHPQGQYSGFAGRIVEKGVRRE